MHVTDTETHDIVADPRRLIALEAAHNVRDLGGYGLADGRMIEWGRLLRGDGLHHLTDADLDALAPIGLRTSSTCAPPASSKSGAHSRTIGCRCGSCTSR